MQSKPVECFDSALEKLVEDMLETMYASDGCGLAAVQVGIHRRILVIDIRYKCPDVPILRIINPVITWRSEEVSPGSEGCLSIPEQVAEVPRHKSIKLSYQDTKGSTLELEASDFLAVALQHEIDHLNGRLYIDYLSPIKRERLVARVQKSQRS
jgi:peptide deformylase